MRAQALLALIVLAAGGLTAAIGCAYAGPTQQLASARAAMLQAQHGAAAELEPDELLIAQRSLTMAEGQADGSPQEAHYAYVAERETRTAMADARRDQIEHPAQTASTTTVSVPVARR